MTSAVEAVETIADDAARRAAAEVEAGSEARRIEAERAAAETTTTAEAAVATAGAAASLASTTAAAAEIDAAERMRGFEQRSDEWRARQAAELAEVKTGLGNLTSLLSSTLERLSSTPPISAPETTAATVAPETVATNQNDADGSQGAKTKPGKRRLRLI